MSPELSGTLAQDLRTVFGSETALARSDGELLERFASRRDSAAFEALVARHGPMVYGVCRRVLGDHHDAEDAFQAVFVVLARRSGSVRPASRLASWLYGVAWRTSRQARLRRQARVERERQGGIDRARARLARTVSHGGAEGPSDESERLDRELARLPEKYRAPIILCALQGLTHQEAAASLGWPVGTVSGRLSRGRALLAKRLTGDSDRNGMSAAWLLAAGGSGGSVLPEPRLGRQATAAGMRAEGAPTAVRRLASLVIREMAWGQAARLAVKLALAVALVAGGGWLAARRDGRPPVPPPSTATGGLPVAGELPRYRLEPGMVLTYRGQGTTRYQSDNEQREELEATAWVLDRVEGGRVRLLVRERERGSWTRIVETQDGLGGLWPRVSQTLLNVIGYPRPSDPAWMDYFSVYEVGAAGHVEGAMPLGIHHWAVPDRLFPRLPGNEAEAEAGWAWRVTDPWFAKDLRAERVADGAGWAFRVERRDAVSRFLGDRQAWTFAFDLEAGLVRRIGMTYSGASEERATAIELKSVEQRDAAWLADFRDVADRFIRAARGYVDTLHDAGYLSPERATAVMAEAETAVRAARDAVRMPAFRATLEGMLEAHAAQVEHVQTEAQAREAVLDRPAPEWRLTDLEGKVHTLEEYRGRALVLVFWDSQRFVSLEMLPRFDAIAREFADRPVEFLAMTMADQASDGAGKAREALGITVPILVGAKPVAEAYHATEWLNPVVVIAPDGVVREVAGGGLDWAERVRKAIEEVLR